MSVKAILLLDSQWRLLREVLVTVDQLAALPNDSPLRDDAAALAKLRRLGSHTPYRQGIAGFDEAVSWRGAGRIYFGLTPGAQRALVGTLERLRPMWDDGKRGTRHVRWFLRKLSTWGQERPR